MAKAKISPEIASASKEYRVALKQLERAEREYTSAGTTPVSESINAVLAQRDPELVDLYAQVLEQVSEYVSEHASEPELAAKLGQLEQTLETDPVEEPATVPFVKPKSKSISMLSEEDSRDKTASGNRPRVLRYLPQEDMARELDQYDREQGACERVTKRRHTANVVLIMSLRKRGLVKAKSDPDNARGVLVNRSQVMKYVKANFIYE